MKTTRFAGAFFALLASAPIVAFATAEPSAAPLPGSLLALPNTEASVSILGNQGNPGLRFNAVGAGGDSGQAVSLYGFGQKFGLSAGYTQALDSGGHLLFTGGFASEHLNGFTEALKAGRVTATFMGGNDLYALVRYDQANTVTGASFTNQYTVLNPDSSQTQVTDTYQYQLPGGSGRAFEAGRLWRFDGGHLKSFVGASRTDHNTRLDFGASLWLGFKGVNVNAQAFREYGNDVRSLGLEIPVNPTGAIIFLRAYQLHDRTSGMIGFQFPLWVTTAASEQGNTVKTRLLSSIASDNPKYTPGAYLNTVRQTLEPVTRLMGTSFRAIEVVPPVPTVVNIDKSYEDLNGNGGDWTTLTGLNEKFTNIQSLEIIKGTTDPNVEFEVQGNTLVFRGYIDNLGGSKTFDMTLEIDGVQKDITFSIKSSYEDA